MANSEIDPIYKQIDRLSNLSDALLVKVLSFLPTHIAARTSALCRRFRHLWEASPSLALIGQDLPDPQHDNFIAMAKRSVLCRNHSHPLLSLHLEVYRGQQNTTFLSSLLVKARSLNVCYLTIDCHFSIHSPILPIIFTINSLKCLSLNHFVDRAIFPSGITLTHLRSLSLRLFGIDTTKLHTLLSELCSLGDSVLHLTCTPWLILSSQTIRKLELFVNFSVRELVNVVLSFPSLESLHLETQDGGLHTLSHIHGEIPLLRKAVINLHDLYKTDVDAVTRLLNWISHAEELSLHIKRIRLMLYLDILDMCVVLPNVDDPIPILWESGKDVPKFSNMKHLDVTLCFHDHNLEDVIKMLHNCPVLESLKLVHEKRRMIGWGSKLPRNSDGNYRYANFRNLHLGENNKAYKNLLSNGCIFKQRRIIW